MLTITFDNITPNIPDGQALDYAEKVVNDYKVNYINREISVSSGVLVDAFRLMVRRKVIPHTEMQFKLGDQIIAVDKFASLSKWPKGFADTHDGFLAELTGMKK